jgi:hypothetical protein
LWLKLSNNQFFFMFNHTSFPSLKFTSCQDLFAKSLYHLCTFSRLTLATSVAFLHQVMWPLTLPHLHHLGVWCPNGRHN